LSPRRIRHHELLSSPPTLQQEMLPASGVLASQVLLTTCYSQELLKPRAPQLLTDVISVRSIHSSVRRRGLPTITGKGTIAAPKTPHGTLSGVYGHTSPDVTHGPSHIRLYGSRSHESLRAQVPDAGLIEGMQGRIKRVGVPGSAPALAKLTKYSRNPLRRVYGIRPTRTEETGH